MNNKDIRRLFKEKRKLNIIHYLVFIAVILIILILLTNEKTGTKLTGNVVDDSAYKNKESQYDDIYLGNNPIMIKGVSFSLKKIDKEYRVLDSIYADGIFFVATFEIKNNNDVLSDVERPEMWIIDENGDMFATKMNVENAVKIAMKEYEELMPGQFIEKSRIFDVSPDVSKFMIAAVDGKTRYFIEPK